MDNTEKFSHKAEAYASGRPSYAEDFLDALYSRHGFQPHSVIADVGSGTGILTEQMLARGSTVYAVEPNADMRITAERELGRYAGFHSVDGTAEHTTLGVGSVDFVTVAQAFHWFDETAFSAECARILKPRGKVFLIWNSRVPSAEINLRQKKIFEKFCPDFKGFSGGIRQDDAAIARFFRGKYCREEYDQPLRCDKQKFLKRSLSASYSLAEGDENYAPYLYALDALFDELAVAGVLTIPNKTVVYYAAEEN